MFSAGRLKNQFADFKEMAKLLKKKNKNTPKVFEQRKSLDLAYFLRAMAAELFFHIVTCVNHG